VEKMLEITRRERERSERVSERASWVVGYEERGTRERRKGGEEAKKRKGQLRWLEHQSSSSPRPTWNRCLHKPSATITLKDLNLPKLLPPTSNAMFNSPSAINRMLSVCCWSWGLSREIRTRRSSWIEGREKGVGGRSSAREGNCQYR
jgi:hypothetical protein